MTSRMCGAGYTRPNGELIKCNYVSGHDDKNHSWAALKDADVRTDEARPSIEVLIENISSGYADAYLEAILAATHGRKRALRGVDHPYGQVC